jgi:hypothetical protein
MSKAISIVLAVWLLQYAAADKYTTVPFRNCTVGKPAGHVHRRWENSDDLACQAQTPVSSLNYGLPFCECTYAGEGTLTKVTKGIQ